MRQNKSMKKKNPTDATLRNVRASKRRDDALKRRLLNLEKRITLLEEAIQPKRRGR